jgi:hypothetical protein
MGVRHLNKALAKISTLIWRAQYQAKNSPHKRAGHFIFFVMPCVAKKKKDFYFWPMLHFGYCPWGGVLPY